MYRQKKGIENKKFLIKMKKKICCTYCLLNFNWMYVHSENFSEFWPYIEFHKQFGTARYEPTCLILKVLQA